MILYDLRWWFPCNATYSWLPSDSNKWSYIVFMQIVEPELEFGDFCSGKVQKYFGATNILTYPLFAAHQFLCQCRVEH